MRLQESGSGMVALGLTFLAFGLAEVLSTNGFVAVFAAAVTIRNASRSTGYLRYLHGFAVDVEKVVTALVLAIFGGAIAIGIISGITWRHIVFVIGALVVARPLAVLVGTPGTPFSMRERLAAGYLGIRGLASLYYAVLAAAVLDPASRSTILSIVALAVLISAVLYGITGEPVVRWVDKEDPRSRASPPTLDGPADQR
jgi:NhaP-type Na+/H+ or K+/H+ antiporter